MPARQEARGIALLEHFDGFAGMRNGLRQIAAERNEWAGIPCPLEGQPLVIEPTYPNAKILMEIGAPPVEDDGVVCINSWYSRRRGVEVYIWREPDGRIRGGGAPFKRVDLEIKTLGASDAWGLEQEARATQLLGTLLRHRQFKQYLLTGAFLEKSNRGGVHYLFRKLRPTVALREEKDHMRILCALCMHPIGHYSESWAGAMCPTDDLIAALMLMRADEKMLWRRSNQIPPYRPNSGV